MYYTETYRKNLDLRLTELKARQQYREAHSKKKKSIAEMNRMINKKLQIEDRLKLMQDIEERRVQMIKLDTIHRAIKQQEAIGIHTDKLATVQMMRRSRSRQTCPDTHKITVQLGQTTSRTTTKQKQHPTVGQPSLTRQKAYSTEVGSLKKQLSEMTIEKRRLEIRIEKKARKWAKDEKQPSFYHLRPSAANYCIQKRPFSAYQGHCQNWNQSISSIDRSQLGACLGEGEL